MWPNLIYAREQEKFIDLCHTRTAMKLTVFIDCLCLNRTMFARVLVIRYTAVSV